MLRDFGGVVAIAKFNTFFGHSLQFVLRLVDRSFGEVCAALDFLHFAIGRQLNVFTIDSVSA